MSPKADPYLFVLACLCSQHRALVHSQPPLGVGTPTWGEKSPFQGEASQNVSMKETSPSMMHVSLAPAGSPFLMTGIHWSLIFPVSLPFAEGEGSAGLASSSICGPQSNPRNLGQGTWICCAPHPCLPQSLSGGSRGANTSSAVQFIPIKMIAYV